MSRRIEHYARDTLTDEVIRARTAHANRMLAEELPDDPPLIIEDAVKRMRNLPSPSRIQTWIVRDRDAVIADATLGWAELPTNRELARVGVSVDPAYRGKGLGPHLMSLAVARAIELGRPILMASSSDRVPAGGRFLSRLGLEPGRESHVNQLVLDRLDRALVARWREEGGRRATGYALELWDGPVPDDRIEAFAELANVMNGEPRGSLIIEDTTVTPQMIREGDAFLFSNGSRRLISVTRHTPSGRLAGFTELMWNPKRATLVWQAGTGVLNAHRNQGLGRWLKAANMEALLARNAAARFVRTGNADSNAPMLAINRRMGFEPFIAEVTWQGRAAEIAERLGPACRMAA